MLPMDTPPFPLTYEGTQSWKFACESATCCSVVSVFHCPLANFAPSLNPAEPSHIAYGYAAVSTDVRGHTELEICL